MLVRGDILVESSDEADDTLDLGDQTSESLAESLAEEEGGERDVSYVDNRLCDNKGFCAKVGLLGCRSICPRPFREGGGDIGFCWEGWNPKT
jgi:hypothetical protein